MNILMGFERIKLALIAFG